MSELSAGSTQPPAPNAHRSTALDPELAAYLDWPLYFPDDSVHCNNFPACRHPWCNEPNYGQVYIASARRMTIREFLADVKVHAEGS